MLARMPRMASGFERAVRWEMAVLGSVLSTVLSHPCARKRSATASVVVTIVLISAGKLGSYLS
jgi:hypothetical protein